MTQPTFTELLDWLEGRLDDAAGADVADRVAHGDRETTEAVEWIRSFLEGAAKMPLQRPPAEVSAALRRVVAEHVAPWAPGDYTEAALAYDSRTTRMAGTRADHSSSDDVFHLVFETDLGQVVLDVMPVPGDGVDVQGSVAEQLRGRDLPTRVVLTSERVVRRTATCDRDGQFGMSDVPAGIDEIWVEHGETLVRAAVSLRPDA
jgi:hypothetical protein